MNEKLAELTLFGLLGVCVGLLVALVLADFRVIHVRASYGFYFDMAIIFDELSSGEVNLLHVRRPAELRSHSHNREISLARKICLQTKFFCRDRLTANLLTIVKRTKRLGMSQRKKPRRNSSKKSVKESPAKTSPDYMRNWLENVKKSKNFFQHDDDLKEIISEEDSDEFECNLKELEKPLKTLLKTFPDSFIRKRVSIECEWDKCSFECSDDERYDNHVHDHLMALDSTRLKCLWNLCKYESDNRTDFLRHLDYHAYHTRLKTFGLGLVNIISVPNCQSDSKFRNVIPAIPTDYFCYWDGCAKNFTKYSEYLVHVSDHVEAIKLETPQVQKHNEKITEIKALCRWDDCTHESHNVFSLKRHLKCHTNEKMIGCANCGVLFVNKPLFIDHCVRQDVNQRNFQCPDCFRLYPSEKLLKEHARGHVNKFQCGFCGLSWQKKSILARHIRYRHISEKPFACNECDYKGKTKADLDSHENTHKTGEILFKCEVFQCDYSSRTLQALKRHDAKVHLERPSTYKCHCCDVEFERGATLSKHLTSEHGFKLAPGHSRFIYKQDFDGFYRLQTKRVENLREEQQTLATPVAEDDKMNISYEIDNISMPGTSATPRTSSTPINFRLREIIRPKAMSTPSYSLFGDDSTQDSKDINDFAIVKNYENIIKKRKLAET